ncbi:diacylglycerol kinase family protein [Methylosinus sp. LW4]|uniref:diacylglycerol kinase family protein n=1 Tax=Methylosinus sp. LW4 TaxID=136993 RepID=UPI003526DAB1
MICCALIAFLFAPLLLLARACRGASRDPLAWRFHAPIRPALSSDALSWRARMRSFSFAFAGLAFMLRTQPNAWAHLVATLLVICAGLLLRVSLSDWRWLIAAISSVWMAEAINTAIEHVCDVVSPGFDLSVKRAKDIAAGAVLVGAIGAAAIGATVFLPYLDGSTMVR